MSKNFATKNSYFHLKIGLKIILLLRLIFDIMLKSDLKNR